MKGAGAIARAFLAPSWHSRSLFPQICERGEKEEEKSIARQQ